MKKVISLILAFLLCLSLSACSEEGSDIKVTNNEVTNNEVKASNALVGTWYSDSDGIVINFSETGKINCYYAECNDNDNPSIQRLHQSYTLKEDNRLETYSQDDTQTGTYDWKVDGDILILLEIPSNYEIILQKVNRSEQSANLLVGRWKLLSMGHIDSPSYQYWEYDVTFYSDGSFVSKHIDYYNEEERTTNSKYTIIHDGSTLHMEFTTSSYWDYEFVCDDVMLVTIDNSQLLYIAQ